MSTWEVAVDDSLTKTEGGGVLSLFVSEVQVPLTMTVIVADAVMVPGMVVPQPSDTPWIVTEFVAVVGGADQPELDTHGEAVAVVPVVSSTQCPAWAGVEQIVIAKRVKLSEAAWASKRGRQESAAAGERGSGQV